MKQMTGPPLCGSVGAYNSYSNIVQQDAAPDAGSVIATAVT